jgi:hypothetical protein
MLWGWRGICICSRIWEGRNGWRKGTRRLGRK